MYLIKYNLKYNKERLMQTLSYIRIMMELLLMLIFLTSIVVAFRVKGVNFTTVLRAVIYLTFIMLSFSTIFVCKSEIFFDKLTETRFKLEGQNYVAWERLKIKMIHFAIMIIGLTFVYPLVKLDLVLAIMVLLLAVLPFILAEKVKQHSDACINFLTKDFGHINLKNIK